METLSLLLILPPPSPFCGECFTFVVVVRTADIFSSVSSLNAFRWKSLLYYNTIFPLLPPFSTLLHPSYTLNLSSPPLPCYTMHVCTPFAHILSHRISSRAIILITSNFEFHLGASIRYSTCSVSRYVSSTFPTISSIRYISLPSFVQHPSSSSSSSSRDSFRKPTSYSDLNPIYLYSTF